mmetsp:Transcript_14454/g.23916  ORF Transcript_14454/g.23916 Transcript_14454/m.23916 type:complete len:155 (-) Transcript_14454:46-510(-)
MVLNSAAEVIESYFDGKPKVVNKKFLWVIDMAQKYVKFEDSATLQSVCDEHDGLFANRVSTVEMECKDPNNSRLKMPFEVKGFSACLSSSCSTYEEVDQDKAFATQFKKKMLDKGLLGESGESMICTMSGGAMASSSLALVFFGAAVSVLFYLI